MEELFEEMSGFLQRVVKLFRSQVRRSYNDFNLKQFLRIAAIIGVYLILRPFIVKLFAMGLDKQTADEEKKKKKKKGRSKPGALANKKSPNSLRYGPLTKEVEVSDDTESEEEVKEGKTEMTEEEKLDQKARRRGRRHLRAKLDDDEMEQLVQEEWDDPDLTDLFPVRQRK